MALLHHTGLNILQVGTSIGKPILIMPGINEISTEDFSKIEKHPSVRQRITDGILKVLDDGKSTIKKSIVDMKDMILKIFDKKLLNKIIKSDNRPEVVEAAKDQLEKIVTNKDKEKEEVEHFN